jgi:hypothetical protein
LFPLAEAVCGRPRWGWPMMPFSILKMLYSQSDTTGAQAGLSICTLKSCNNICCRYFLLNKKFYLSTLQKYVLASYFPELKYDCITGRQCDFQSGVRSWMELVITYYTLRYCLAFVRNSVVLMTFYITFLDKRILLNWILKKQAVKV